MRVGPGREPGGDYLKIPPPAPCNCGAWRVKTRPAPPRNHHKEVDVTRKHGTFRQTVKADKCRKPLTEPLKNGSRVLVRGRPYTCSPRRSKKLEPHWFGPFKVLEHLPDTANSKLQLPPRMDRQKAYFHVSSFKEYRENDPDRFKSSKEWISQHPS